MKIAPSLSLSAPVLASLVACAAPQERPSDAPAAPPSSALIAPPPASAPASATASASAAAPALPAMPPAIQEATGAVCTLRAPATPGASIPLALPGARSIVGWVESGEVSVALGASAEEAPVVDVTSAHAKIRLLSRRNEIVLYPKKPLPVGDVAVFGGKTRLSIRGVDASGLSVSRREASTRLAFSSFAFDARTPCDGVGLLPSEFSLEGAIPAGSPGKPQVMLPGKTVLLRASEKGPVVVEITTPKAPPKKSPLLISSGEVSVSVLKTSGGQSQVLFDAGGFSMFGWVPSAMLTSPAKISVAASGMLGLLSGDPNAPDDKQPPPLVCDAALPLVIEQGDTRFTLGTSSPGACIELRASLAGWSTVALHGAGFSIHKPSRLLVPSASLQACRPVQGPRPEVCKGMASDEALGGLWGDSLGDGFGLGGLGLSGADSGPGKAPGKTPPRKK